MPLKHRQNAKTDFHQKVHVASKNNKSKLFHKRAVQTITGDITLGVEDSGKVFLLNNSGGATITLPSMSGGDESGWYGTFIVTTVSDTGYTFNVSPIATIGYGPTKG